MAEKNKICHLCGGELEPYGIGKLKCKYCDTIYEEEVINGEEGVLLVNAYNPCATAKRTKRTRRLSTLSTVRRSVTRHASAWRSPTTA